MGTRDFPEISYAEWRRAVESQLGEATFESTLIRESEGVRVEALQTARHPATDPLQLGPDLPDPGPATLPWTACQRFDQGSPENLNRYLKDDVSGGVDGLRVRLGRIATDGQPEDGADVRCKSDYLSAMDGVPQTWRVLLLDAGAGFLPAAAQSLAALEALGLPPESRTLLWNADPIGTLAAEGALPAAIDTLTSDLADLVSWSQQNLPGSRAIGVDTSLYREAGAAIDQEVAIGLATGVQYLRDLEEAGVSPEVAAAQLAFLTAGGQAIFPEIAKLRSLRYLWGRVLTACGVTDDSIGTWIHTAVLRRSLTQREPAVNLLRVSNAAFAAIAGETDSLETPEYDWYRQGDSSARGRRLARNTQSILGLESHLGRVQDPGAGSYQIESLTSQLVERSWESFQEIERRGGVRKCLLSGWLQNQIARRWQERCGAIESGEIPLVGVSVYARDEAPESGSKSPSALSTESDSRRSGTVETSSDGPIESPTENRWSWCLEAAAQDLSLEQMVRLLYEGAGSVAPTVAALRPVRDEEAVGAEPGDGS